MEVTRSTHVNSQGAGAFGHRGDVLWSEFGKKSILSKVAKRQDWFDLFGDIRSREEHSLPFYEVRPLVPSNLKKPYLRCYFGLSLHLFFKSKVVSFFLTATKVGPLEGNNRMTDCLFQIIGSTVP